MNQSLNWKELAFIQIGGAICLPIFVIGHLIFQKEGASAGYLAIILGNAFLLILGLTAAHKAALLKKSAAEISELVFGSQGKIVFALGMMVSMIGWFGIQLSMMGEALNSLFPTLNAALASFILGLSLTFLGFFGLKGVAKVANLSVPLLAITILYALSNAYSMEAKNEAFSLPKISALSIVIAASMGAIIDLPTFFKNAKSIKDSLIGAFFLFGLALPLLECVGVFLASRGHGENFMESLAIHENSFIWKIWVSLFVLLAGWTTNNTNLYSASISMKSIFRKFSEAKCLSILGIIGTLLSLTPYLQAMGDLLEAIGIVLGSLGGVILAFYFGLTPKSQKLRLLIMGLASLLGWGSFFYGSLLFTPSLDAFAAAFLGSLISGIKHIYQKLPFGRVYEIN